MRENKRSLRLTVAAMAILSSSALIGCTASDGPAADPSAGSTATVEAATFNAADVMFVQMMTPHHQQAIQMSDLLLAKQGVDPRVRELAEQIKAAQGPEIEKMAAWAKSWGVTATPAPGHDHGDGDMGMLDEAQLNELRGADGEEATKLFLAGMIEHHEGAIAMAEDEQSGGDNADAVALAGDVISTQQAEIDTMNDLLSDR